MLFPVFVEKAAESSGAKKQFTYSGFRESRGMWGARQIEVWFAGASARTLLVAARGSAKGNLTARDFEPR